MSKTTIAAVATPMFKGGIGVIRISGDEAFSIGSSFLKTQKGRSLKEGDFVGGTHKFCMIYDGDTLIDECVVSFFVSPKSYTGENVLEISCHGGVYILKRVLKLCLNSGAAPAAPGEFTKRAFLNGKLDLTEAEAVADLIDAQSEAALKSAISNKEGALHRRVNKIYSELVNVAGDLAAFIDYPDEGVTDTKLNSTAGGINSCLEELKQLASTYDTSISVSQGIKVSLVGKPNVGKSSILNTLCGEDKVIVTNIPGTTRDVVETTTHFGSFLVTISDTAGIRETDDVIEQEGVKRSLKSASRADVILCVFDGGTVFGGDDQQMCDRFSGSSAIAIINKTDLKMVLDINKITPHFSDVILFSAETREGVAELKKQVIKKADLENFAPEQGFISNLRQLQCVESCIEYLQYAKQSIDTGFTVDTISLDVEQALDSVRKLTGEKASEDIVSNVFSRFCVGK